MTSALVFGSREAKKILYQDRLIERHKNKRPGDLSFLRCPYCGSFSITIINDDYVFCRCGAFMIEETCDCWHNLWAKEVRSEYRQYYRCEICDYEDWDCFMDLYGSMSVPWGHL